MTVINFTPRPKQAATEVSGEIVVIPYLVTHRAWVDRESFKIAGMVGTSTQKKVWETVYSYHCRNGVPREVAAVDADLTLAWVKARLDQLQELRKIPAITGGSPTWQAN